MNRYVIVICILHNVRFLEFDLIIWTQYSSFRNMGIFVYATAGLFFGLPFAWIMVSTTGNSLSNDIT